MTWYRFGLCATKIRLQSKEFRVSFEKEWDHTLSQQLNPHCASARSFYVETKRIGPAYLCRRKPRDILPIRQRQGIQVQNIRNKVQKLNAADKLQFALFQITCVEAISLPKYGVAFVRLATYSRYTKYPAHLFESGQRKHKMNTFSIWTLIFRLCKQNMVVSLLSICVLCLLFLRLRK